jgi:hypothetical protein
MKTTNATWPCYMILGPQTTLIHRPLLFLFIIHAIRKECGTMQQLAGLVKYIHKGQCPQFGSYVPKYGKFTGKQWSTVANEAVMYVVPSAFQTTVITYHWQRFSLLLRPNINTQEYSCKSSNVQTNCHRCLYLQHLKHQFSLSWAEGCINTLLTSAEIVYTI